VGGLSPNTRYHFRVVATNATGTGEGADQTLTTLPEPPAAVTGEATEVSASDAVLNASVNPHGGEVTSCQFEYGPTPAYGSTVPCSSAPGSGEASVAVSAVISGLKVNSTYYFRIVATNAGGTAHGGDA